MGKNRAYAAQKNCQTNKVLELLVKHVFAALNHCVKPLTKKKKKELSCQASYAAFFMRKIFHVFVPSFFRNGILYGIRYGMKKFSCQRSQ